jgi:hypothetical protein
MNYDKSLPMWIENMLCDPIPLCTCMKTNSFAITICIVLDKPYHGSEWQIRHKSINNIDSNSIQFIHPKCYMQRTNKFVTKSYRNLFWNNGKWFEQFFVNDWHPNVMNGTLRVEFVWCMTFYTRFCNRWYCHSTWARTHYSFKKLNQICGSEIINSIKSGCNNTSN